MAGIVEWIGIATSEGATIQPVASVKAVKGRGLEGDRKQSPEGSAKVKRNLTLIERSAYGHLASLGIAVEDADLRRNLIVSGIDLNALVGKRFRVGAVECLATGLCDPCRYIEERTSDGVLKGLVNRGGLCAEILSDGVIALGDPVEAIRGQAGGPAGQ